MSLRVAVRGEVKAQECRSRRETESEQGVQSRAADPKPSDLSMASAEKGWDELWIGAKD